MRKGFIAAACIGAVALPAVAVGGPPPPPDPEYGGKLDDKKNHYFGFDVEGRGDDRKIRNSFVVNMAFDCRGSNEDGPQSGELRRAVDVKRNGTFDETVKYRFTPIRGGGPAGIKYRLTGDLDGDRATGTLRVQLLDSIRDCDSGTQDFVAKKPSPPVPDASTDM